LYLVASLRARSPGLVALDLARFLCPATCTSYPPPLPTSRLSATKAGLLLLSYPPLSYPRRTPFLAGVQGCVTPGEKARRLSTAKKTREHPGLSTTKNTRSR